MWRKLTVAVMDQHQGKHQLACDRYDKQEIWVPDRHFAAQHRLKPGIFVVVGQQTIQTTTPRGMKLRVFEVRRLRKEEIRFGRIESLSIEGRSKSVEINPHYRLIRVEADVAVIARHLRVSAVRKRYHAYMEGLVEEFNLNIAQISAVNADLLNDITLVEPSPRVGGERHVFVEVEPYLAKAWKQFLDPLLSAQSAAH